MKPGDIEEKKFHHCHGSNVILENDDTVACRNSSYANALVFSKTPLKPFDLFMLEIVEIERGWSGDMRIGLTTMNPNEVHASRQPLPQYALPDLNTYKPSWIFCISKSIVFNKRHQNVRCITDPISIGFPMTYQPLEERCATDVGSKIGVIYIPVSTNSAELHFIVNGIDQGVFVDFLPYNRSPLFVVVDVYGCTKKVRIVKVKYCAHSLQEICRRAILQSIRRNAVSQLPLPNPLKDYLLTPGENGR